MFESYRDTSHKMHLKPENTYVPSFFNIHNDIQKTVEEYKRTFQGNIMTPRTFNV